jgi:hypothetical protein
LLQVYPKSLDTGKYMLSATFFSILVQILASLVSFNTFVVRRKFHRNWSCVRIINTPFCNKVGIEIIIYVVFIFIWSSNPRITYWFLSLEKLALCARSVQYQLKLLVLFRNIRVITGKANS